MVLQVLNARFRPYILAEADTLDTVTQAVSMVSILLAQYVHATSNYSEGMSKTGKKVATVLFLVSNLVLTLAHVRFISAPLFAKVREAFVAAMACARGIEPAEPDGAEEDEVVSFDRLATQVSSRFNSSLWATRISESVMQDVEMEMNPVNDIVGGQGDRMTMQTVLQQWRTFASTPSASSPEKSKEQSKDLGGKTKRTRSNELQQLSEPHSSAATDAELPVSVLVHI